MSTPQQDPLDIPLDPVRVHYELGVMLDKDDFRAEQAYHRGRLARALSSLHGSGTVAGLAVAAPEAGSIDDVRVRVKPGIALDRVGRLIEVRSERCARLHRWVRKQAEGDDQNAELEARVRFSHLCEAFHPGVPNGDQGVIVVDVMLRFAGCETGKTPSFPSGPFDALDAVQPSRVADAFELQLVPRIETEPPTPVPRWPDLSGVEESKRVSVLHDAILAAWGNSMPGPDDDPQVLPKDPMVPDWLDHKGQRHWLFLARLQIPATRTQGQLFPSWVGGEVDVNNEFRSFVYTSGALARLVGF